MTCASEVPAILPPGLQAYLQGDAARVLLQNANLTVVLATNQDKEECLPFEFDLNLPTL